MDKDKKRKERWREKKNMYKIDRQSPIFFISY